MSVLTRPTTTAPAPRASRNEPASAWILTAALVALVGSVFVSEAASLVQALPSQWGELLFWTIVIVVVNLLPLTVGEITLTLDMPILLAVSFLYPPGLAGFVAVVAAIDVREWEGRVPFLRAVFNRFQVGACVMVASVVFHSVAGSLEPALQAAWGTIASIAAFHFTNVVLVTGYTWLRIHTWNRISIGGLLQFLITYLGYGVLALVVARLYRDVGAWSVVTLVIPILVAREALLRAQRLQLLADQLRERERLLERLFDRIVDERKDERLRISADLHDDVLQSLVRISQLAGFLRQETAVDGTAAKDAEDIHSLTDQTIKDLRHVVADLRASPLGRGGLVPTLKSLGRDLQLDWQVPIRVEAPADLQLRSDEQVVLYQVAKEGLVNALKHARPTEVSIRLSERDSDVFLEVRDDGQGFDVASVDTSSHFGLGLVEERVRLYRGSVELASEKGSGTRLSVRLPREINPKGSPRTKRA
jgi:signal transduction histidine kinase